MFKKVSWPRCLTLKTFHFLRFWFVRSFVCLFSQQVFIESLLCARHWARILGIEVNQTFKPALKELFASDDKTFFYKPVIAIFSHWLQYIWCFTTLKWNASQTWTVVLTSSSSLHWMGFVIAVQTYINLVMYIIGTKSFKCNWC